MTIGSLSTLKTMLGISGSGQDTYLGDILDAVDDWIEQACNRQLANAVYTYQKYGTDDRILSLPNRPINNILWTGRGATAVIDVTYDGSTTGLISIQDNTITLSENLVASEVDLTSSSITTISDVATAINNLANWSATASSIYSNYPARVLLDRTYDYVVPTSGQFSLVGAVSPVNLQQEQDGLYRMFNGAGVETMLLIIYDGGYSTYPDGLIMAATKIAADTYHYLKRDGAMEEEELGDYRYKVSREFINSAIESNWSTLSQYANISV